jgi:hypothetical protein
MVWPIIAGAAAPWLLRGAPAIGRGAQSMWNLGKGLGTAQGRRQAGRALWQQPGSIPRNPVTGAFEAGSRGPGAAQRAGQWFAGQPTWKQSLMGAGAGTVPYMMWPDPDEEQPEDRPVDSATLGVPGAGPSPTGRSIQGGFAQRAIAERERMLENMSMLMKQGAILSFVNPKGAKEHTKRAIEIMKMDAKSRNAVEDAKIIEDVFKDGKLPKTAKTLYNRLAPRIGPAKAAEVSGYTLEIEKTEAEAAADFARSQPKLSDMYSKDAIMLSQVQAMYAQSPEAAIKQLADWMMTKVIDLSDQYVGYKPQSQADYLRMAGEILSGTGGGGVSGVGAPSGEVTNIGLS